MKIIITLFFLSLFVISCRDLPVTCECNCDCTSALCTDVEAAKPDNTIKPDNDAPATQFEQEVTENDSPAPEDDPQLDDPATDEDIVVPDDAPVNQFPNIEGIWKLDDTTFKVINTDCVEIITDGSVQKPFRKFKKTDAEHVFMWQCRIDDDYCADGEEMYPIGEYMYDHDMIHGTGLFVEPVGAVKVKTRVDANEITFSSETHAHAYNKLYLEFYWDDELTVPYPQASPCVHEVEWDLDKNGPLPAQ